MPVQVGVGYVDIRPDMSGFGREVNAGISKELAGAGAAANQSMAASLSGAAKAAAGVFAGLGVKRFLGDAVQAASSLEEAASKVGVVFGEQEEQVRRFAAGAAEAIGQSERSALEATGTFGNLFTAMGLGQRPAAEMSISLVRLASDLASFNNTSVDDALVALRSGLVGETEPLKRFGVNMNEATLKTKAFELGLVSSTKEGLSPSVKAQAAYALVLEQTSKAQGDFERTSAGLANQQRSFAAAMEDFQASIGETLLPLMTALTQAATTLLGGFLALPGPVRTAAVALAGLGAAGLAIALLAPKIKAARVELQAMGAAGVVANRSLSLLGKAAGLALTVTLLAQYVKNVKAAQDVYAGSHERIRELAGKTEEELKGSLVTFGDFQLALEEGEFALARRLMPDIPGMDKWEKAYADAVSSAQQLNKDQAETQKILGGVGDAAAGTAIDISGLASAMAGLFDPGDVVTDELDKINDAARAAAEEQAGIIRAAVDQRLKMVTDALDEERDALEARHRDELSLVLSSDARAAIQARHDQEIAELDERSKAELDAAEVTAEAERKRADAVEDTQERQSLSLAEYKKGLEEQTRAARAWITDVAAVSARADVLDVFGTGEEADQKQRQLQEQILALPEEARAAIGELAKTSDSEFSDFIRVFSDNSGTAAEEAAKQLGGIPDKLSGLGEQGGDAFVRGFIKGLQDHAIDPTTILNFGTGPLGGLEAGVAALGATTGPAAAPAPAGAPTTNVTVNVTGDTQSQAWWETVGEQVAWRLSPTGPR